MPHAGKGRVRGMIAKWLVQSLIWLVVIGALLFVPAGTLDWPAAWVLLAMMGFIAVSFGIWLARTDPDLLAERMRLSAREEQPAADKKLVAGFGVLAFAWFVAMGLDHRFHAPAFPPTIRALGLLLPLGATLFIMWVMRENSFAAPLVKIQHERGHRVVWSGPYAWVRHPMYSGAVIFVFGLPLLLGSGWGLVISPLFVVMFAIRARIEERTLIDGLPGYAEYAARVRYRLIPGIW